MFLTLPYLGCSIRWQMNTVLLNVSDTYETLALLRRLMARLPKFTLLLKDIDNETLFTVGFLKFFINFEILYNKVCIQTSGRTITRLGNIFHKIYVKQIETSYSDKIFVI